MLKIPQTFNWKNTAQYFSNPIIILQIDFNTLFNLCNIGTFAFTLINWYIGVGGEGEVMHKNLGILRFCDVI